MFFMGFIILITLLNFATNLYQKWLLNKQKVLIKLYEDRIKSQDELTKFAQKYCLADIISRAVEIEDYETATKAQTILNKLLS